MILALSGSLRRRSLNSAALRAVARAAARSGLVVEVDDSVRSLPPFDPDLDAFPPRPVMRLRRATDGAEVVLLAVPEYTFGIPGALKNALDWLVRSGSLYHKPVALLHVSPPGRGARVRESLTHVLSAHNAVVTHHRVPIAPRDLDEQGEIGDPRILEALAAVAADIAGRAAAAHSTRSNQWTPISSSRRASTSLSPPACS